MGNLEKLVVLTVIFLSGIVLAVSLSTNDGTEDAGGGEERTEARSPQDDLARRASAGLASDTAPGVPTDGATRGAPPLLSADVARDDDVARGADVARGETATQGGRDGAADGGLPKGVLRRVPEITETAFPDLALYTCRGTETYASLARRLYGGVEFAAAIEKLNEGHEVLTSGDELLVPLDARPGPARERSLEAQPWRPAPRTRNVAAPAPIDLENAELGTTALVHTVAAGESLSEIAARYYGKASLWRRIYDHNREVLDDPDRLPSGVVIEIP